MKKDFFSPWRMQVESYPCFMWKDILISPKKNELFHINEKDYDLINCMKEIYPDLSLIELIRFYFFNKEKLSETKWREFFKRYGISLDLSEISFFQKIFETPFNFQRWAFEKKLFQRDLMPLRSVSKIKDMEKVLNFLSKKNPSKSQGVQFLELAVENYLNKKEIDLDSCFLKSLENLKKVRRPLSSKIDERRKDELEKIHWPSQTKASFVRNGDESFLKLELKMKKIEDLNDQLDCFKKNEEKIKEILKNPWK